MSSSPKNTFEAAMGFPASDPCRSRLDLLERTKLSNRPGVRDFSQADLSYRQPSDIRCAGCTKSLDGCDDFQRSVKVCKDCQVVYGKVYVAHSVYAERVKQERIEKSLKRRVI